MNSPLEEVKMDRENAFLLYACFGGDCVRTAAAVGVRPVDILRTADECGWADRLKPILELQKSAKPGDVERSINRALNFTQAHRMRMFLERVVARVTGMDANELDEYLMTGQLKDGSSCKKLSTRALADLASALEKCHSLTYQALGDTAPERTRRAETGSVASGSELHVQIAEAMQKIRGQGTPRAQLLDGQLAQAEILKPRVVDHPADNDDH